MLISQLEKALYGYPPFRFFTEIGSTNDEAIKWAENSAPDYSIVIAEYQTAGRGRLQRRWYTPANSALAISIILRPTRVEFSVIPLFTALAAIAISNVLINIYGLINQIKWPNDVLINNKKVAGILAETIWQGFLPQSIIIGVGLNITKNSLPAEETLNFPATCIESELGRDVDRVELLKEILDEIKKLRPTLGSNRFLKSWRDRLAFKGQRVLIIQQGHLEETGNLEDVAKDGSLLIKTESGNIINIQSGDVRLRVDKA